MKILLSGIGGHMGREVLRLTKEGCRGMETVAGVDAFAEEDLGVPCAKTFDEAVADVDCIVDFSHHSLTHDLLDFAVAHGLPVVLATTGQTAEEREYIETAAKQIPVFFAANYSVGVALLIELAKKAAQTMPDAEIEIVEKHHDRKLDAPSGTALAIADAIKNVKENAFTVCGRSGQGKRSRDEIGIHAIRMGNIVGEHEVILGTASQTLTLKHEAHSRALFAEGALAAAEFLANKAPGLYNMTDMIRF